MRFVQKWSYGSANHLASILNENHQKRACYYYGFQIIYGELLKGIILMFVAFLLGIFVPTLLICLTFASLRMVAGGYHMDTYGKCLFVSMVLFIGAGLIAGYTYYYWSTMYIFLFVVITFILGCILVIKYAPKDTPNKPITDSQEIKRYKRLSLVYLGVWVVIVVLLTVYSFNMIVLSLCLAVLLEMFTVTPVGERFFEFVRQEIPNNLKNV